LSALDIAESIACSDISSNDFTTLLVAGFTVLIEAFFCLSLPFCFSSAPFFHCSDLLFKPVGFFSIVVVILFEFYIAFCSFVIRSSVSLLPDFLMNKFLNRSD
jgi:hypothetical protein